MITGIELTRINTPEPDKKPQTIRFAQYPNITLDIFDDNTFGVNSPFINVNSPSETETPIHAIQWGNVMISLSEDSIYLDAEEVNFGSGGAAPLQLINTDIRIVWEGASHE
ncbi:hypothetical protein [Vibrio algivorus]|uniref:Uncharacterized protein n=1 Tax=Vibrio algivorus TaxID=1667024 RepID=A0A557NV55_9VIBR|nr:hypothetical protein [Vibrio algivorus]TVO32300.1 hypothetical protein FOF44_17130 [Vibrio algivorus]